MGEIWKDITGYEGFYQISNKGNIRSIACRRGCHGKTIIVDRVKDMSPTDNGNGYLIVSLKSNNKRKSFYIHRLVAAAFLDKPDGCDVVNHIDFNKLNNSSDNLEWVTQKANVIHSSSHMRHEKKKSKPTNTGYKYITKTKDGKYRVCGMRIFKELETAIEYRNEVMNG